MRSTPSTIATILPFVIMVMRWLLSQVLPPPDINSSNSNFLIAFVRTQVYVFLQK